MLGLCFWFSPPDLIQLKTDPMGFNLVLGVRSGKIDSPYFVKSDHNATYFINHNTIKF